MTFQVNRLVGCNFLLQFAIFVIGSRLHTCGSVTYIPSKHKCHGDEVTQMCKTNGQNLVAARISDSSSLKKVQDAIKDSMEYWTGLSWHHNHNYCWNHNKDLPANVDENIVAQNGGRSGWFCFLVKETGGLEAGRCGNSRYYICEQDDPLIDTVTSSELAVATKLISTQLDTATRTGATSTVTLDSKAVVTTLITPETVALTLIHAGLVTPTLTSTLIANKVLTSNILQTTAIINIRETSTVTLTSSITDSSNKNTSSQEKQHTKKKLLRYVLDMRAIDVSNKKSLQDAVNTTSTFLKDLKKDPPEKNEINILVATQELESFAIHYGKLHYNTNESNVISQELFEIRIQKVSANIKEAVTFSVNETDCKAEYGGARISIPSGVFKGQDAVVVSILYNGIKQWIPDYEYVELDGKTFTNLELGSRIIASTVDPRPSGILQENVTMSFSYNKEALEEDTPYCVFWNFNTKSKLNGSWSGTGCSLVKRDNKEITCTCNHLTNFAVLMQVGDNKPG